MDKIDLYIIMPIYNAAETLPRAVRSLSVIPESSRRRVRLLGVDDGSTDNSREVFSKQARSVDGLNWELKTKENGGSGSARNVALKCFDEGWVLCLDSDDELTANPFSFIDKSQKASAILFDIEYYQDGQRQFSTSATCPDAQRLPESFSSKNPFHPLSIIFRRERLDHLFAEDLLYLEDWHFLSTNPRVFAKAVKFRGFTIGRVHSNKQCKSADQYKNGYYRVIVAERLAEYWKNEQSAVVVNNLLIQRAIGMVQMGKTASFRTLLCLPASLSLYAKLLVYMFGYRLYLRLYPYA